MLLKIATNLLTLQNTPCTDLTTENIPNHIDRLVKPQQLTNHGRNIPRYSGSWISYEIAILYPAVHSKRYITFAGWIILSRHGRTEQDKNDFRYHPRRLQRNYRSRTLSLSVGLSSIPSNLITLIKMKQSTSPRRPRFSNRYTHQDTFAPWSWGWWNGHLSARKIRRWFYTLEMTRRLPFLPSSLLLLFFATDPRRAPVSTHTAALWQSTGRLSIVEFISFRISRVSTTIVRLYLFQRFHPLPRSASLRCPPPFSTFLVLSDSPRNELSSCCYYHRSCSLSRITESPPGLSFPFCFPPRFPPTPRPRPPRSVVQIGEIKLRNDAAAVIRRLHFSIIGTGLHCSRFERRASREWCASGIYHGQVFCAPYRSFPLSSIRQRPDNRDAYAIGCRRGCRRCIHRRCMTISPLPFRIRCISRA